MIKKEKKKLKYRNWKLQAVSDKQTIDLLEFLVKMSVCKGAKKFIVKFLHNFLVFSKNYYTTLIPRNKYKKSRTIINNIYNCGHFIGTNMAIQNVKTLKIGKHPQTIINNYSVIVHFVLHIYA